MCVHDNKGQKPYLGFAPCCVKQKLLACVPRLGKVCESVIADNVVFQPLYPLDYFDPR